MMSHDESTNEPVPFNRDEFIAELLSGEYRMRFNEAFQLVITWHPDDETMETKQYIIGQEPVEGAIFGLGTAEYVKCVQDCANGGTDKALCAILCIPKLAESSE